MLPASCKAKGRVLQNKIAEDLREAFQLSPSDVKPALMSENGMDIKLSEAARKLVPFALEAKATETLQIWASIKQCEENAAKEKLRPALVFKRNRSGMYVCLGWRDFLALLDYMLIAKKAMEEKKE